MPIKTDKIRCKSDIIYQNEIEIDFSENQNF